MVAVAGGYDFTRPDTLPNRAEFEKRYEAMKARFRAGEVPRPSHWGGYRMKPDSIEFWSDRPHRLHERRLFTREGSSWSESLLYP